MSDGRGGTRPGAGRPSKATKYGGEVTAAEDRIVDQLPQLVGNMLYLANGFFEEVEELWEPAGLVMVNKELITDDGRSVNVRECAFPHLPPEQLVCVQRKKRMAAPDRRANEYLINRIAGTPTPQIPADTNPGGAAHAFMTELAAAVLRVYGAVSTPVMLDATNEVTQDEPCT